MKGILLVDKPSGWTSFDVVNYVRRQISRVENKKPKNIKVGHAGTLDPFATGLLILFVGKDYTRKTESFMKKNKTYEFEIVLGKTSSTGDPEGKIVKASDLKPTNEQINKTLMQFQGKIEQIPPIYSAIKIDGIRSYRLARKGQAVQHNPRPVLIENLEALSYDYPVVKLKTTVSSGTYIRVLAEDIGRALNTGAYTSYLRRLSIDKYNVSDAIEVKDINSENIAELLKRFDLYLNKC